MGLDQGRSLGKLGAASRGRGQAPRAPPPGATAPPPCCVLRGGLRSGAEEPASGGSRGTSGVRRRPAFSERQPSTGERWRRGGRGGARCACSWWCSCWRGAGGRPGQRGARGEVSSGGVAGRGVAQRGSAALPFSSGGRVRISRLAPSSVHLDAKKRPVWGLGGSRRWGGWCRVCLGTTFSLERAAVIGLPASLMVHGVETRG